MYPIVNILGLQIHTYYIFLYSAILISFLYFLSIGQRIEYKQTVMFKFGVSLIILTLILSRTIFLLFFLPKVGFKNYILKVITFWRDGGSIITVIITGVLIVLLLGKFFKFDKYKLFDLIAPALILGQAIGRVGCFLAGCCYGRLTNFFLGVIFTHPRSLAPLGTRIHPVQLYEALGCFLIFFILNRKIKNKQFEGEIMALYVMLYSSLRMFMEYFRADSLIFTLSKDKKFVLSLNVPFIISMLGIVIGFLLYRKAQIRKL